VFVPGQPAAQSAEVAIQYSDGTGKISVGTCGFDQKLYLPLRQVCESLEIQCNFSKLTDRTVLVREKNEAVLFSGMAEVLFNGKKMTTLKEPLRIESGQIYLLPEDIAILLEGLFGFPVQWQAMTRTLLLNVQPEPKPVPVQGAEKTEAPAAKSEKPPKQWRIVIDPGHGGKQPGAIGKKKLKEKEVNLDIALRLARLVQKERIAEVILTRYKDEDVSLSARAEKANAVKADFFVSIHSNAGMSKAKGTEVYIFDITASNKDAADLANEENADVEGAILDVTKFCLEKKAYEADSINIAGFILASMAKNTDLKARYHQRILRAPFYVLRHSEMPAVLLEVAFISNPQEEKLLRKEKFREQVAEAICLGIKNYVNSFSHQDKEEK